MPGSAYVSGQVQLPDWWVQRWLETDGTVELPWPVPPTTTEVVSIAAKLADMEERLAKHAAIERDAALVANYAAEAEAKETERVEADLKATADARCAEDNGDAELLAGM